MATEAFIETPVYTRTFTGAVTRIQGLDRSEAEITVSFDRDGGYLVFKTREHQAIAVNDRFEVKAAPLDSEPSASDSSDGESPRSLTQSEMFQAAQKILAVVNGEVPSHQQDAVIQVVTALLGQPATTAQVPPRKVRPVPADQGERP